MTNVAIADKSDWRAEVSQRGIGGSDAAVAINRSPWRTPLDLWKVKIGDEQDPDLSLKPAVEAGNRLEGVILDWWMDVTGKRAEKPLRDDGLPITFWHPEHDFLFVHPDAAVIGENAGVEIKNVGMRVAHRWGGDSHDDIPEEHLWQCHHTMLVKGWDVMYVAVLIGGQELRTHYFVERNETICEYLVEAHTEFWTCVQTRTPPAFDLTGSSKALEVIRRVYPGTNGQTIFFPEKMMHWHQTYQDARRLRLMYEKIEDGAQAHILAGMGENAVGVLPDGSRYERKIVKRKEHVVKATSFPTLTFKGEQEN